MGNYQPDIIVHEVNNLITYSCRGNTSRTGNFNTLHRAIIKKHFNAFDIILRNEQKEIDMKIQTHENEFVQVSFKCPDLELFLKSCIERDPSSLLFYQNMLTYYNVVSLAN